MGLFKKVTKGLVKWGSTGTKLLAPVANAVAPGMGDLLTKASAIQANLVDTVNGDGKLNTKQLGDIKTIATSEAIGNLDTTDYVNKVKQNLYDVVLPSGQKATMSAKNAALAVANDGATLSTETKQEIARTAKKTAGNGFLDWLKTIAGGAASAVGVKLAGEDAAAAAAGDAAATIGKTTAMTWLKNNWWKILLPVAVIGGIIYYAKRKPKTRWRR